MGRDQPTVSGKVPEIGWHTRAGVMASDFKSLKEDALEAENAGLRELLSQAEIDAARLLAKAGIDATENEAAKRLQRLLLEELHHRVKNTLATVIAITSQSLRTAETLEKGRVAVESRLVALGRAHDLLLQANWSSAKLTDVIRAAIEPFDAREVGRFVVQDSLIEIGAGAVLPLTMSLNELCTNAVNSAPCPTARAASISRQRSMKRPNNSN